MLAILKRHDKVIIVIGTIILVILGGLSLVFSLGTGPSLRSGQIISPMGVTGPFIVSYDGINICTNANGDFPIPSDWFPGVVISIADLQGKEIGTVRLDHIGSGVNRLRYIPAPEIGD